MPLQINSNKTETEPREEVGCWSYFFLKPYLDKAESEVQQTSQDDYEVEHVPAVSEVILLRKNNNNNNFVFNRQTVSFFQS